MIFITLCFAFSMLNSFMIKIKSLENKLNSLFFPISINFSNLIVYLQDHHNNNNNNNTGSHIAMAFGC